MRFLAMFLARLLSFNDSVPINHFEDPANDQRVGGEGETVELGQGPLLFGARSHPDVTSFCTRLQVNNIVGMESPLRATAEACINGSRHLLRAFQLTKRVKVTAAGRTQRQGGLLQDGARAIFNLHPAVKAAAFKINPVAERHYNYVIGCIQHFAAARGWRVASLKVLENVVPGWTAYRLGRPAYMHAAFHLPLGQDCDSGVLVEMGAASGAAAERAIISDERGQAVLCTSLTGTEAPGWRFADAVRGHCLSVIVDFVHAHALG
ncbi:beta-mannosidase [Chlorella sorokiniana]|uniref:Beta-mannosidase n=1 Tax=Chlorella sorokiniana TaxID=3076 RepID=A0A2P6TMF2_CHLSO|nr:beta-mannosidase [Chlorella sorokiniana]|eukprot:PRW45508.1 beta-mannosidase [Chlorella sorokiniana]